MKITDVRMSLRRHPTKVYRRRPINAITDVAIHHSLTLTGSAESYANYHVNTHGWPGIGYHFVIEKNGEIKWCNDLDNISYHIGNSNGFAVGICLTGDFRSQKLTAAQEASLRWLCNVYLPTKIPKLKNIKGHNQYPGYALKQCPVFDFRKVLTDKSETIKVIKSLTDMGRDCSKFVCKGAAVKGLQDKLMFVGEKLPRFGADSDFGQECEDAVKAFQARHGLIVDGVVGVSTLNKLNVEVAKMNEYIKVLEQRIEKLENKLNTSGKKVSDWAKENWDEAKVNGYFDGTRPLDNITRQESAVVVNRLRHNFLKLIHDQGETLEVIKNQMEKE